MSSLETNKALPFLPKHRQADLPISQPVVDSSVVAAASSTAYRSQESTTTIMLSIGPRQHPYAGQGSKSKSDGHDLHLLLVQGPMVCCAFVHFLFCQLGTLKSPVETELSLLEPRRSQVRCSPLTAANCCGILGESCGFRGSVL